MPNIFELLRPAHVTKYLYHPERMRRIQLLKKRDSSTTSQNDEYKNNDGITLIEVIISIAILGAVIVPLMTLFVMSAKINNESNREYMSILAAQMYIEEIKAMDNIDTSKYIFNSEDGSYERTVVQTNYDFGAEINITPYRNLLYIIEVMVMDNGEIINSLTGSKLMK